MLFKLLFLSIIFISSLQAKVIDKLIAVVNDEIISLSDLEDFKKRTNGDLNALIEETLLRQLVKKLNLSATDEEVNAHIENILKNQGITQKDLMQFLKQRGLTYAGYRETIRHSIEQQRLIERELHSSIVIRKEDVRAYYYSTIKNKSSKKKYHIRQIFFHEDSFGKAQSAFSAYKKGLSFDDIIKQHVSAPEEQNASGDLGFLSEEDMSGSFKKVVMSLPLKKLSQPFKTKAGIHLVEVLEVQQQSSQRFEEVKDEIQKILYEKEFQRVLKQWLRAKKEEAFIKIIH